MRIKKLDVFIIKSFLQPFAATFFISISVLLLQHLWKYIDDLAGKGLEWYIILEFMFYSMANLIPLALPLAILLASIMTFGNLGEKYELTVIKAAGIPLRRVFVPLVFIIMLVSLFALWFSIKVIPVANLKWGGLYYDVMQKKPAFDLKEGIFYNGIQDYSIKVAEKSKDGSIVRDVIIYDHSNGRGNTAVIVAEYGEISYSEDKRYLFFNLHNGKRYEEMVNQPDYYRHQQFSEMTFGEQRIAFNLSDFGMNRTDLSLFKDFWRYKKLPQLEQGIDSLYMEKLRRQVQLKMSFQKNFHFNDTIPAAPDSLVPMTVFNFDSMVYGRKEKQTIAAAMNLMRGVNGQVEWGKDDIQPVLYLKAKYEMVWWQKFTLSVACMVLFFIGAPLGAIVRKGGFGLPVVFAIIFFLFFYMLNIIGEKMVRELVVPSEIGMWISTITLTPLGLWLTLKATRDSALFNAEAYLRIFKRFKRRESSNT